MQRSIFLFTTMIFFFMIITPKLFSDSQNKRLHTKLLSTFSSKPKTSSSQKYFSFGIGYQYFFWGYDLSRRQKDGSLTVIHQSSQYHGMNLNAKFSAFRPWGVLTTVSIYFPFSVAESVHLAQNKTHLNSRAKVVKEGTYLLKNIPSSDTLKGIGITTAAGVNYSFQDKDHFINIGLGLSWIVFMEDLYRKNKQNRTSSKFGFMFDSDYQFRFSKIAGIFLGIKFAYYPIDLFNINNIIGDYSIKSTSMLELSFSIAPVFYF